MKPFDISYYHDYISPALAEELLSQSIPVDGISTLQQVGPSGGLETKDALQFLADLYSKLSSPLKKVLEQRVLDRRFIDERVKACYELNKKLKHDFLTSEYQTILIQG